LFEFLKETFPDYASRYKDEQFLEEADECELVKIFSLLLYFSYYEPTKFMFSCQDKLSLSEENKVLGFLWEFRERDIEHIDNAFVEEVIDKMNNFDDVAQKESDKRMSPCSSKNEECRYKWLKDAVLAIFNKQEEEDANDIIDMDKFRTEIEELTQTIQEREKLVTDLSKKLQKYKDIFDGLDESVVEDPAYSRENCTTNQKLHIDLGKYKERNDSLEEAIEEMKEEHEKIVENLTLENLRLQEDVTELRESNEALQKAHDELKIKFEIQKTKIPKPIPVRAPISEVFGVRSGRENPVPSTSGLQFISGFKEFYAGQRTNQSQQSSTDIQESRHIHQRCRPNKCRKMKKYKQIINKLRYDISKLVEQNNCLQMLRKCTSCGNKDLRNQLIILTERFQRDRYQLFDHYTIAKKEVETLTAILRKTNAELNAQRCKINRMKTNLSNGIDAVLRAQNNSDSEVQSVDSDLIHVCNILTVILKVLYEEKMLVCHMAQSPSQPDEEQEDDIYKVLKDFFK